MCVRFTYQVLWKEVALLLCRSEPWGPGCGGGPGPAGWLHSSLPCLPSESEVPQERSASVVLEEKERSMWGRDNKDWHTQENAGLNFSTCGVGCGFGDGVLSLRDGLQYQIPVGLFGWRESRPETIKNRVLFMPGKWCQLSAYLGIQFKIVIGWNVFFCSWH